MPLAILLAGLVIEIVAALIRMPGTMGWTVAMAALFGRLIVGTAVMLVGMVIVAKLRAIELGSLWLAVLKLSAVAIGPGALMTLLAPAITHIPLPAAMILGLGTLVLDFVLYFALLGAMFRLEESDTWVCVWVFLLLRIALHFAMRLI